ncbi:hypothetical protein [Acetobacter nitrogenifigens]|uniref:hypothetical protein n=1 Tax=Acetobacter nitrogenifigens TaxID=285268 RepID=UPI0011BE7F93|nr:hypothetical protein [Acetobacter nitrogenifigens]
MRLETLAHLSGASARPSGSLNHTAPVPSRVPSTLHAQSIYGHFTTTSALFRTYSGEARPNLVITAKRPVARSGMTYVIEVRTDDGRLWRGKGAPDTPMSLRLVERGDTGWPAARRGAEHRPSIAPETRCY